MAVVAILPVLLVTAVIGTTCDKARGFQRSNDHGASQFGEILKPPPPPPLSKLFPVPFHGGTRVQRQNNDLGYQYPPPPPPPSMQQSNSFRFPAPFYKQYNFNFVPPPQPFITTTQSPGVFQKVSNWLFTSNNNNLGYDEAAQPIKNSNPEKKQCNPCNLVPWIPVIRYDLSAKNLQHNINPTYGAPSPTATHDALPFTPQPFVASNQQQNTPHTSYGVPHSVYGPPPQYQTAAPFIATPSSTYGPPSPTHTISEQSKNPPSTNYGVPNSNYRIPNSNYGVPSPNYGVPSSNYGVPNQNYKVPSTNYGVPSSSYEEPSSNYGVPSSMYSGPGYSYPAPSSYSAPSSTYGAPSSSYQQPSATYGSPSSTYGPPSSTYGVPAASYGPPQTTSSPFIPITQTNFQPSISNDVELIRNVELSTNFELPKISNPTGFRNSYGEPISSNALGIPFAVSATGAESTRVKTEVLPNTAINGDQNGSIALANPKPFTLNKGRNIHTLQPVALPNLSVSPLPPIFNARPFRTSSLIDYFGNTNSTNSQTGTKNYDINKVPVTEFSHTVDHPITVVKSPIIDFSFNRNANQSKAYRNIVNSFVIDQHRDISSQASEDHIAATKTTQEISDSSFETTGPGYDNVIYDIPNMLKNRYNFPTNDKSSFADLSKASQADVDNYRTESNLQSIDSPLLYLKPSAPHKEFNNNFLQDLSTVSFNHDYELYDEGSTTTEAPRVSLPTHIWDNHNLDSKEGEQIAPTAQGDSNKPKIVQIVIPYTTGQQVAPNHQYYDNSEPTVSEEEYQGRKVPTNTESYYENDGSYSTETTTAESSTATPVPDDIDSEIMNTPSILNDLYDVRDPPFDIIKLQNSIDDWTEQQYSQQHRTTQRVRVTPKFAHAKQIPDEYFTTASPSTYATTSAYDYYDDHESASSVQQSVTENKSISIKPLKEYNILQRLKDNVRKYKHINDIVDEDGQKPHIYTAASTFRGSTTTYAPWGKIQTSISPLTKEKVYVVTSKPWAENANVTDWYESGSSDTVKSYSDNLPFKSPRFINRPSFPSFDGPEIMKSDASYGISRSWHQLINDLTVERRNHLAAKNITEDPQDVNPQISQQISSSNATAEEAIT